MPPTQCVCHKYQGQQKEETNVVNKLYHGIFIYFVTSGQYIHLEIMHISTLQNSG